MRNLKKVLSLVLCVAVMLSVMVLGAGAAFSDQADIENTEAVDACSALNIIGGYEDGSFHPERNIKRSEITKMICVALNGGKEPNVSTNAVPTFNDVRGTSAEWAEGYIESCVAQGIVSGVGGGRFSPDGNVTGAQLAKMLLVALGYNSDNEGFTGNAWETNVNVRAAQKHLYDGLESMDTSAAVTRDQAAQMVWNAMQAYEVEYKTNIVTDANGNLVTQIVVQDKVVGTTDDKITLLEDKYEAFINVGTLVSVDGKNLTISMSTSDVQDSHDDDGAFLNLSSDYSSLLGQKVKVMFTKHNNVLGVYSTGENTVVTVNQNAISVDAGKIVIGDKSYAIDTDGVVVVEDGQQQDSNWKAGEFKDAQSADVISLIDTDQDSKIDTAYIKTVDVQKVTYVSASQIIAGSKTYKFADDTIPADVAKDDWVIITKDLYNDNNLLTVADKATGAVDATKTASAGYEQYQIDGTWYNEAPTNSGKDINTNVKPGVSAEYVAVNGILFYAAKTSAGADQLTDVLFVAYVGQDGLTNDQAKVMFPNGDKATITLKNAYSTTQAGTKGADIEAGQFYEYSKSGSTYELIALSNAPDFYGDFTYEGTNNLATDASAVADDKIADTADVIVWTSDGDDAVAYKHITGKQLKALVKDETLAVKTTPTAANELFAKVQGYFTSDVDGLNRASVIAVQLNGGGSLGTYFDNISSNANYGFITKDADKLANGKIKFTVWTGTENLEVIAEKSNEAQFTAGTIVGYTAIEEQSDVSAKADGTTYVMTDAVALTAEKGLVTAGSITGVNSAATKIETNIPGAAGDLSDYSTVLYVDSKAGTGLTDGKAVKANSQEVNGTTYYATNLLVYGTEVIVIDVNEIAGSTYGAYTLQDTISGLKDVQWLNTRTNDTDEGEAYKGAVMQLSFYATSAGKLTLKNVADIESNDNDGTVVLEYEAGYNKFDSLIVMGNVTASIDGSGSTTTSGNVKIVNNISNTSASAVISKVNGHLTFTLTNDAITSGATAKVDYALKSGNTVIASDTDDSAGTVLNGSATFTIAQDVSGYDELTLEISKPTSGKFLDKVAVEFTGLKVTAGGDTSATLTTDSASPAALKFKVDASELTTVNTAEVNFSATNINGTATGKTSGAITGGAMAFSANVSASTYAVDDTKKVVVALSLTDVVNARKVSTTSSVSGYTVDSTSATKYISGACNIVLTGPKYVKDATVKYKTNKDLNTYSASSIDFSSGKGTIDVSSNLPADGDITVEIVAVVPAKYAAKVVVEDANGLTLATTTNEVAVTDGTTVASTVLEGVIDTIFADNSTSTATAAKKVSLTVSGATFSNGQNTITTASALTTSNHASDAKTPLKTALSSMTLVNVTGEITFTVNANVD